MSRALLVLTLFGTPTLLAEDGLRSVLLPSPPRASTNAQAKEVTPPKSSSTDAVKRPPQPLAPEIRKRTDRSAKPSTETTKVTPSSLVPLTTRRLGVSLVSRLQVPVVRGVILGSAADVAGIQPGDRIDAMDGSPVASIDAWEKQLRRVQRDFSLTISREAETQTLRVKVPIRPRKPPRRAAATSTRSLTATTPTAAPPTADQTDRQAVGDDVEGPLIGEGGRLFGNHRVINSVRRFLRRDN